MSYVFSQAVNALQLGSIYALVALGYSMVYGIILLLNFAHGDIIMVGAYVTYYAMTSFHLHPLVSVVLAVVMCTLLGVVIEKVAYTPLRSAPRLSLLITAIGVSFLLENGAQLIFGTDTKSMVQEPLISGSLTLGGVSITYAALITIVVSVVSMIALTILVQKTKLGKAMRAVSEDMGAAQLMGISLNRTISFTFAVGPGGHRLHAPHRLLLPGQPHDGFHAGPEGLCGGSAGRYRLHSGGHDRWLCHRHCGDSGNSGGPFYLEGRRGVCHPYCGAAAQAYRHLGQEDYRKSVRGRGI